jgi:NitT/TauT family transport system ATP-binding protein
MTIPFLKIDSIYAQFISRLGQLDALKGVTFDVARGEFICLIGPSGCGKSTLLRIIAGLIQPSEGQIHMEGQRQQKPTNKIGMVFQQPTLLPWRTVEDNIALPLEMRGGPAQAIAAQTEEMLALVDLVDFRGEYPANLSGGMAQRAAIARALAQNPEVLLLDEPFGALDALTREIMAGELLRIWENLQRTVVMVTHNVEEAVLLADRVIVLSPRPGHVIEEIVVPLARPRTSDLLGTAELQAVVRHLRDALYRGNQASANVPPNSRATLPSG